MVCRVANRDLAVLAWRRLGQDRSEDRASPNINLTMETGGIRSLSLPSQTRGRLGRVSKSPEREATPQRYQHGSLQDRRGRQWEVLTFFLQVVFCISLDE